MIMMIEGPPFLALDDKGGVLLTIYPCGGGMYLHAFLSIYPRIVDMYEPICGV
jgi:hypothetical protein